LRIAVQGQAADVEVLRELLSPWNVSFTSLDEAEVVIVRREKPLEAKKTVVIPSDSADFMKWVKDMKLRVVRKLGEPVFVAASSQTVLTIMPQMLYCYDGAVKPSPKDTPTVAELNEDLIFLTLDVVKEYDKILDETLNAKSSTLYRLLTGLPVPYTLAPRRLRDFFMRKRGGKENLTFCDKLPLDALRFILVTAIENLLDERLQRKTWNGKKYACTLTHDIDTRNGLQKAKGVKKLEEKYNVPSAWYIPSKHYELNHEIIKELANYGEVGAHSTRHDGKLVQLPEQKLVRRLREAKQTLERIINCSVEGFRAPLLQHSKRMIRGLEKAGYEYDTSIPTWEPMHPRTRKPHGIGTTYPLTLEGITEIPVTMPQDHQMLRVMKLAPKGVVAKWGNMMETIKEIGGLCTVLVHPDYELAHSENLAIYEELLNMLASDDGTSVSLPAQIADLTKSLWHEKARCTFEAK
jgi:peptidoglycan/xylan/chitin deacetylase (PgdA/CDA1 family)